MEKIDNISFVENATMREDSGYNYKGMANIWRFCIPYEGNEHLLDTTKDVEG